MQILKYQTAASDYLSQAFEELEDGDLRQAFEKGWGAAASVVKAVAERRGWEHQSHDRLFEVAALLAVESGDVNIRRDFQMASSLHTNLYEGWLHEEMVRDGLHQVQRLLTTLEPLLP